MVGALKRPKRRPDTLPAWYRIFFVSFNVRDHYPIGQRSSLSRRGCRSTQPACLSNASFLIVNGASFIDNGSVGGLINWLQIIHWALPFSSHIAFSLLLDFNSLFKIIAFLVKFNTERRHTLQRPQRDPSSVIVVEYFKARMVFLVLVSTCKQTDVVTRAI